MASSWDSNGCRAVGGCIILHKFCYKYESRTDSYTRPDILKSINCFVLCYAAARLHIAAHTRACTFSTNALAYKHILAPQQQHAKSKDDVLMGEQCNVSDVGHKYNLSEVGCYFKLRFYECYSYRSCSYNQHHTQHMRSVMHYDIYQLLHVSTPKFLPHGVIITKLYKPTCQYGTCLSF